MITKLIIKNLQKELDDRDTIIKRLKRKNHELNAIKNDWIEKDLVDPPKKFPSDYIKQKKEFADTIESLNEERRETFDMLNLQYDKHTKEISLLKFEIEMLEKQVPKKPSIFDKLLGK